MKLSSKLAILIYGFISMLLLPVSLVAINSRLNLPVFKFFITQILGIIFILSGGILGLVSILTFAKNSQGGSAFPLDPPQQLITTGIYKYSRNPMFVASGLVWLGEFLFFGSILLFFYALFWMIFNHIHLITQDEKWLEQRYGNKYKKYKQKVPRYFFKF